MKRTELIKPWKSAFVFIYTFLILAGFVNSYSQTMKKIYSGTDGSHYYVKNLPGTTFGSSDNNEFYLYWKMDNTTMGMGGELSQFKSSEISPGTAITSATNILPSDNTYGTYGYHEHYNTSYSSSAANVMATPSYTLVESSDVRIRLKVDKRTVDGTTLDYDLTTIWTVYPTGQIFRYDSVGSPTVDLINEIVRFRQKYDASVSNFVYDPDYRGVVYGGTSTHDFALGLIGSADKNGPLPLFTGSTDTISYEQDGTNYMGLRFTGVDTRATVDAPFRYAFYLDIQHNNMNSMYMDSVCNAVQYINFTAGDMFTGTRVTTTEGDINSDGFNEAEGAYMMQATSNTVDFVLQADGATDGSRFYPAFHITNYTVPTLPSIVSVYDVVDTVNLIKDEHYNVFVNDPDDELILQIDSVFRVDTKIHIAAGDLGLTDHVAGQESDAFSESGTETVAELYAFQLTPSFGTLTVNGIVFSLSSITGLIDGDWTNVEIMVDDDGDGMISGGETNAVGGTPTVSMAGQTITFSNSFDVNGPTNYILRADFPALSPDDAVTIDLTNTNITSAAIVSGTATTANHLESGTLTIIAPNGTESWIVNDIQNITWNTNGTIANVDLAYSIDGGLDGYPYTIASGVANLGTYSWTIPDAIGNQVRVKVTDALNAAVNDASDGDFSIKGSLTLTTPNGTETWIVGDNENITWMRTGSIANVMLEYSTDGGSSYLSTIVASTDAATGSYSWMIPDAVGTLTRVKVTDVSDATVNDASDGDFSIEGPTSAVSSPSGSITSYPSPNEITGTYTYTPTDVEVSIYDGVDYWNGTIWTTGPLWLSVSANGTVSGGTWTMSSSVPTWSSGVTYSIQSRALDGAYTETPAAPINFDYTGPTSLLSSPSGAISAYPSPNEITGTYSNTASDVEISIFDGVDYWNGTMWTTGPIWLSVSAYGSVLAGTWSMNSSVPTWTSGTNYTIETRAIDGGYTETPAASGGFTYTGPTSLLSSPSGAISAYPSPNEITGTYTKTASDIEISICDGVDYWNGTIWTTGGPFWLSVSTYGSVLAGTWTMSSSVPTWTSGTNYTIETRAIDGGYTESPASSGGFTYTGPTTNITAPIGATGIYPTQLEGSYTGSPTDVEVSIFDGTNYWDASTSSWGALIWNSLTTNGSYSTNIWYMTSNLPTWNSGTNYTIESRAKDGPYTESPAANNNFTYTDATAPSVSSYSPADNATNVAIATNLVLTFDEAVYAGSGYINLYKTIGDVLIQSFDVTADISGSGTTTITADPTSDLDNLTDFYVQIDAAAFADGASNSYAGIADNTTWNFTTQDINDAPTDITLTSNVINEGEASGTVVGTFSTTDADVGDNHTYTLVAGTGSTDNGSFAITGSDLQTAAVFDYETQNSFSIRVRTTDNGTGNLWYEEMFTISVSNVNEAPVANDESYTTDEDTPLTITGAGVLTNDTDEDGDALSAILVTDVSSGSLTLSGDGSFIYTPNTNFTGNDLFTYQANDGTVNSNVATVTITVNDISAPTVVSLSPADGATGVGVNDNLVIVFSEVVNIGTGTITIAQSSDLSVIETIDVISSSVTGGGSITVTIDPATTFQGETGYYITIGATCFADVSGNYFPGYTSDTDWNFTVADIITEIPALTAPASGVTLDSNFTINFTLPEAALSGSVKMLFSQTGGTIDPYSPHIITFLSGMESAGAHSETMNGNNLSNSANIASVSSDPNDALVSGALYDVTIQYQDVLGNPVAQATNSGISYYSMLEVLSATYFEESDELMFVFDDTVDAAHIDTSNRISLYVDNGSGDSLTLATPWGFVFGQTHDTLFITLYPELAETVESWNDISTLLSLCLEANTFGNSMVSNELIDDGTGFHVDFIEDINPPEPVTGLAASAQNCSTMVVSWTPSSSPDVEEVKVCASTEAMSQSQESGEYSLTASSNISSITMTGLPASGVEVFVAAFVVDKAGNWVEYSIGASDIIVLPDGVAPENVITAGLTNIGDSAVSVSLDLPDSLADLEAGIYFSLDSGSTIFDTASAMILGYHDTVFILPDIVKVGWWYGTWAPFDSAGNIGSTKSDSVKIENTPPVVSVAPQHTLLEDSIWTIENCAYDINSDPITLSLITAPPDMYISQTNLSITWAPDNEDVGSHTVALLADDGATSSDTALMTLTVVNTNDPPEIISVSFPDTAYEDSVVKGEIAVYDCDLGDSVSLELSSNVPWLSASQSVPHNRDTLWRFTVTGTPLNADTGSIQFTATATDKESDSIATTCILYVINTNDAPETQLAKKDIAFGAAQYIMTASDDFDSVFTFHATFNALDNQNDTINTHSAFTNTDGIFTYYPLSDGRYFFACYVEDQDGLIDSSAYEDTLTISGVSVHTWSDSGIWNMISVPAVSHSVESFKTAGTILHWDESRELNDVYKYYVREDQIAELAAGSSYWSRLDSAVTVALDNTSLSRDSVSIQLHKAEFGWNQIASPYPYPVKWSENMTLWEWNETLRDFVESEGVLYPWEGYWVLTEAADTVTLSPEPLFISRGLTRRKRTSFVNKREWTFGIELTSNINRDADNLFGISKHAKNGYDALDRPEPPRMGSEPYIYFAHPEWKRSVDRFASDIRRTWKDKENVFQVGISPCAKDVTALTLNITGHDEEMPIYLFVNTPSGVMEYKPGMSLPVQPMGQDQYRTIFATSDKDFLINFPHKFKLRHPYPNPCRPTATIRYTLPYRWDSNGWLNTKPYKVKMVIYDARGRVVCELVNRKQEPGNYRVIWRGKSDTGRMVASGFYFCRLVAGKYTSVKKIIAIR